MEDVPNTPGALLLITLWLEPAGPAPALRARILRSDDIHGETAPPVLVAGRQAVLAVVGEWLDTYQNRHAPPPPNGPGGRATEVTTDEPEGGQGDP
ncbi:hypothetical protein ACIBL6_17985 [Streptomyces sp. NPDC050400]|uniref:hypothetical protein n=1 Tax=Streptomyces sp. NPDC050400 TaxID=3365610 RepID=UPI00378EE6BD